MRFRAVDQLPVGETLSSFDHLTFLPAPATRHVTPPARARPRAAPRASPSGSRSRAPDRASRVALERRPSRSIPRDLDPLGAGRWSALHCAPHATARAHARPAPNPPPMGCRGKAIPARTRDRCAMDISPRHHPTAGYNLCRLCVLPTRPLWYATPTPTRALLVPSLARQPLLTRLELLALEVVRAGRREDKARRRVAARHLLACLERERPRLVGLGGREGQVAHPRAPGLAH